MEKQEITLANSLESYTRVAKYTSNPLIDNKGRGSPPIGRRPPKASSRLSLCKEQPNEKKLFTPESKN
jgi:hypothetical protein